MSDFDLNALVREVLSAGGCATYREYAEKVTASIPASEYEQVVGQLMVRHIRQVNHEMRQSATQAADSLARLLPGQHASSKVRAIGHAWHLFLAQQITVAEGVQVRLADATSGQVRAYADLLLAQSRRFVHNADRMTAIADAMEHEGAARVRELPDGVGMSLIRGTAA